MSTALQPSRRIGYSPSIRQCRRSFFLPYVEPARVLSEIYPPLAQPIAPLAELICDARFTARKRMSYGPNLMYQARKTPYLPDVAARIQNAASKTCTGKEFL